MSKLIGLLLVFALAIQVSGCSRAESQQMTRMQLESNSCAISCPNDSAYPDLRGSVVCVRDTSPICQCSDKSKGMATCEFLK